jgi:antitoxin ParD1/3/4
MHVLLSEEMAKLVSNQLDSGRYRSADEVIEAALELLRERDAGRQTQIQELRGLLAQGLADLERGDARPLDRDSFEQLKREARERMAGAR